MRGEFPGSLRPAFVDIQQPDEISGEANDPNELHRFSNWPDYRPDGRPRSGTVVIRRDDGGVIGT